MRTREERKTKKKGQETTIGKIIYSFLLFLPLLAIGVTCGYAMFNKNAYQSYNETVTNMYHLDNTNEQLIEENHLYTFNGNKNPIGNSGTGWQISYKFTFNNESLNLRNYFETNFDVNGIAYATDGNYNQYYRLYLHDSNLNQWIQQGLYYYGTSNSQKVENLKFRFNLLTYDNNFYLGSNILYTITTNGNLSNVFYYSIDRVTESPLFNWAENSIIYTTTANTCTALSITTPFIPLLMSYWLIISVIYFLYDIALMLVWIIHKKIHELQESI